MSKTFKDIKLSTIESWGKVFQDIEVFQPLIETIFEKHNIEIGEISNLIPGSNAVFRVDNHVVKIYAPKEVELLYGDYEVELSAIRIANENEVCTPRIIAHGIVEDTYIFPYIIMGLAEGVEASDVINTLDEEEKVYFIERLNKILNQMNKAIHEATPIKKIEQGPCNPRWDMHPSHIKDLVTELKKKMDIRDCVFVHGDLTGENVLIKDREIQVIDFGDVRQAPKYYEYAALVFDLFDCDKTLVKYFAEGREDFVEDVVRSIILHEFGANIVRDLCDRHLGITSDQLVDFEPIKIYLTKLLSE